MTDANEYFSAKFADRYGSSNAKVQFQYGMNLLKEAELRLSSGQTVLDIGCGTGDLAAYCARAVLPDGIVVAVDPDKERIRIAKEKFRDLKNLKFYVAKSTDFPADIQYDVIISNAVFHWVPHDEKTDTFKKMFESLKPQGLAVVLCTTRHPTNVLMIADKMPSEFKKKLEGMVHFLPMDALQHLFRDAGFDTLKCGTILYDFPWSDENEYLEWMDATFYGDSYFKKTFETFTNEISLTKYEDGTVKHDCHTVHFVLRKPEMSSI